MDLDQLFTCTDYQTSLIRIPSSTNSREGADDDTQTLSEVETLVTPSDAQPFIEIELSYSAAASTDYDLTGQVLWPVSVLLGHYLASTSGSHRIRGRSVVELGAGTGLPGLVAAKTGAAKVAVTDGNPVVLDLLSQNVSTLRRQHESSSCELAAQQCVWGDRTHCHRLLRKMDDVVDVVVAADVVQWPAVVEPLLHTVKAFLWKSTAPEPVMLLGIVNRAASTYEMFFSLAETLGFSTRSVPYEEFLANGALPKSCREFGGRQTEIVEAVLTDRSELPILLREDNAIDCTIGATFENTTFLPC
jgi:predicted nicotinamide N-methyase